MDCSKLISGEYSGLFGCHNLGKDINHNINKDKELNLKVLLLLLSCFYVCVWCKKIYVQQRFINISVCVMKTMHVCKICCHMFAKKTENDFMSVSVHVNCTYP